MAVTLIMRVPELTLDRYDAMMAGLGLDSNPPPGMIFHVASESVGAVNILEVWQTSQAAESFTEGRLREALAGQKVKDPLAYRIEQLHNMWAADFDMIERIGATSLPADVARSALAS